MTSLALAYLTAADAAIPKTTGDRARIALMDAALKLAIDGKFVFDSKDGTALKKLGHWTTVGIFNPLHLMWYRQACVTGGTYAKMWERAENTRPWIANEAFRTASRDGEVQRLGHNRVCDGLGVLLLVPEAEDPDRELMRVGEYQAWFCTSMTDEFITLCRYPVEVAYPRRPSRVRKVSRDEWATLNPKDVSTPKQLAA